MFLFKISFELKPFHKFIDFVNYVKAIKKIKFT